MTRYLLLIVSFATLATVALSAPLDTDLIVPEQSELIQDPYKFKSTIATRELARLKRLESFMPKPKVDDSRSATDAALGFKYEACTPGPGCPVDNVQRPCPDECKPEIESAPSPDSVVPPMPSPVPSTPAPEFAFPGCPSLITRNTAAYVCDPATVKAATTAQFACMVPDGTGKLPNSGTLKCPAGKKISCFVLASYGNVAGSCDIVSAVSSTKCADPMSGQASGDPNTCQHCVANRCGYSSGPCFDNFVDCFGEVCAAPLDEQHTAGPSCAAYYPESWGRQCLGESSCYMALTGAGQVASWVDKSGKTLVPVTDQPSARGCSAVTGDAAFKALAICE